MPQSPAGWTWERGLEVVKLRPRTDYCPCEKPPQTSVHHTRTERGAVCTSAGPTMGMEATAPLFISPSSLRSHDRQHLRHVALITAAHTEEHITKPNHKTGYRTECLGSPMQPHPPPTQPWAAGMTRAGAGTEHLGQPWRPAACPSPPVTPPSRRGQQKQ